MRRGRKIGCKPERTHRGERTFIRKNLSPAPVPIGMEGNERLEVNKRGFVNKRPLSRGGGD